MTGDDLLDAVAGLARVELSGGERLIAAGAGGGALYVLAAGALVIERDGRPVARLDTPGAIVGEMSLLLDAPATADVFAAPTAAVHRVDDPESLIAAHPELMRHLAETLARRLHRVSSYLDDLHRQFDDRAGTLGLVPTVLEDLLGAERPRAEPGSEREPDGPY